MKKTIIAGAAASAVLAAMPVLGVFAVEHNVPITDKINVTIQNSCTWERTLNKTNAKVTASGDTLSATMTAGETISDFGTSTFNVKCNNPSGYKIKATMSGLEGKKNDVPSESNNDAIDYATTLAAGKWTATYKKSEGELIGITNGNVFIDVNTPDNMESGSTYIVTYGVQTKANQAAGVYSGTVEYELTQNTD